MGLKMIFDDAPSSKAERIETLIIRNLPLLLWQIEAIILYGGSPKGLCDRLAGTTVEEIV